MKILICCDDEEYAEVMKKIMTKYHFFEEREFEVCLTLEEAFDKAKTMKFGLAFIDCLIEGEFAMDIGKDVIELNRDCMIFYMHTELDSLYVNESFIIGTFQFLIKGEDEMMEKEFLRASRIYAKENLTFEFMTEDMEKIQLSPYEMLYMEIKHFPTKIATKNGICKGWFKEEMFLVQHYLKEYDFLQVHSHYLVSMDHVRKMAVNEIIMANGDYLPISVISREKVNGAFRHFLNW